MANPAEYDEMYRKNPNKWALEYRDYTAYWTILACHGQPENLLDIGCGNGHTIEYLHKDWPDTEFSGLDTSPEACRLAKLRAPYAEIYNCELSELDKKYEVALLMGVAEHFQDLKQGLENVKQLLEPDGIVYIESPNCLAYSPNKEEGFRKTFGEESEQDEWHIKRETWEKTIKDAGYKIFRSIKGLSPETEFTWVLRVNNNLFKPRTSVAVIIPSTGRPKQLVACVEQLLKVSPTVEVVCIVEGDPESVKMLEESGLKVTLIQRDELTGSVSCWNEGASETSADSFVLGADDLWFHEGWLEEAMHALDSIDGSGVVGLNSLKDKKRDFDDAFLATRDYCKSAFGGVFVVPHYRHFCVDIEACRHAAQDAKYVYADKSIVEHRHKMFGKAEEDATYQIDAEYHTKDYYLMLYRTEKGWPVDYDPIF